jgi:hypothetical protein
MISWRKRERKKKRVGVSPPPFCSRFFLLPLLLPLLSLPLTLIKRMNAFVALAKASYFAAAATKRPSSRADHGVPGGSRVGAAPNGSVAVAGAGEGAGGRSVRRDADADADAKPPPNSAARGS